MSQLAAERFLEAQNPWLANNVDDESAAQVAPAKQQRRQQSSGLGSPEQTATSPGEGLQAINGTPRRQQQRQQSTLVVRYLESLGTSGGGEHLGASGRLASGQLPCVSSSGVFGSNCNDQKKREPLVSRPLSQAAANRAKFAIRSYTIAVSRVGARDGHLLWETVRETSRRAAQVWRAQCRSDASCGLALDCRRR